MAAVLKTEVLREHLARRMKSQNSFATRLKISNGYLSLLISGQRQPSGDVQRRLLKVTGLTFEELFEIRAARPRVPSSKTLLRIARKRMAVKKAAAKTKAGGDAKAVAKGRRGGRLAEKESEKTV